MRAVVRPQVFEILAYSDFLGIPYVKYADPTSNLLVELV